MGGALGEILIMLSQNHLKRQWGHYLSFGVLNRMRWNKCLLVYSLD